MATPRTDLVTQTRRRRAPRGDGPRLREEILSAATALLDETNDHGAVSIRAVADRVGVTPPSIYLHFRDKSALLFAVCERSFAALGDAMEQAATGEWDPLEALYKRGRAYVSFSRDHPEAYRILFLGKADTPSTWEPERMLEAASFGHLVDAVRECIEVGLFVTEDAFQIALGLWIVMHGIASLLITNPDFPWPEVDPLVDDVLAVQMTGLLKR